jgi:hypothetical protein
MMMRLLRGPGPGQPSVLGRALAAAVVVGLLVVTAPTAVPPLLSALRWLFALL